MEHELLKKSKPGSAEKFLSLLQERIVVFDGAMGTMVQEMGLSPKDFGGEKFEGCIDHLVITRPDIAEGIHTAYLEAGADIIETATFGATGIVLSEYGLRDKVSEINRKAAEIARRAASKYSTPKRPRFVAGDLGPISKSISVTGGVTFEEIEETYLEQTSSLAEGGVDLLILETAQDTLNLKAALRGIDRAFERLGRTIPLMVSVTIESTGTMLAGQDVEAFYTSLEHRDLLSIGLNCGTGPDFMTDHIRRLSAVSRFPVSCIPNAGLPDENGRYHESPDILARKLKRFVEEGWVNIVGGCCGTTPQHIRQLRNILAGKRPRSSPLPGGQGPSERRRRDGPRSRKVPSRTVLSGLKALEVRDDKRPILIGERTNSIGSRIFRELIAEGKWEEASEIGRRQIRSGAQVIDVCLANPERDERSDTAKFLDILTKKVYAPLMIDTTDPAVMEEALKRCQGKAILNSVNLEKGEERLEKAASLAKTFGAAIVVGMIDENKEMAMALTAQRKLDIAHRAHSLLTGKYGLKPENIFIDALVFPVGTGDSKYSGAALETINAVKKMKQDFPESKTILGISNVSFGLPLAGREILNSVFLHHCVASGLDAAIVNTERLHAFEAIPDEERRLAERLLFRPEPGDPDYPEGADPISEFTSYFRQRKPVEAQPTEARLSREEILTKLVVEGRKDGLIEAIEKLLKSKKPMDIINGPLMGGMQQVSRLFGSNELIIAEVLQSAEVMKSAVSFLETRMEERLRAVKGKFILATVKGDVHDIGKNLVHIILKNNGYEVIDLGTRVSPESLIKAIRENPPQAVGLSGLLVTSCRQMAATAEKLSNAGISVPLVVGGAALSARFAASKIVPVYGGPVIYARDAMHGLEMVNNISDPRLRDSFLERNRKEQELLLTREPAAAKAESQRATSLSYRHMIPVPPDLDMHVLENPDLEKIFNHINPKMLYGKHLGLKGDINRLLKHKDMRAVELFEIIKGFQKEILSMNLFEPKGVYRFHPAQSEGTTIYLYKSTSGKNVIETFTFPRQQSGERLCLADYVLPRSGEIMDYIALFTVTCGRGVAGLGAKLRGKGDYLKSHALQALAMESAEALAEVLHEKIRTMWGIGDPPGMTLQEKFQARYRGIRTSFGYPACPNLEDEAKVFKLLKPEKHIGVRLTENFMMDPEASVSAMVFHHPQAKYFSAA